MCTVPMGQMKYYICECKIFIFKYIYNCTRSVNMRVKKSFVS